MLHATRCQVMKMEAGASTLAASDAGRQASPAPTRSYPVDGHSHVDQIAGWLRSALYNIIQEQRPRVPGWGLLLPRQIVGEYVAEDAYLLLVFDPRGRPHTQRFTRADVCRLQTDAAGATAEFRSLIESFCADA